MVKKPLTTPYRKWLNEDVAYIITDQERAAFKTLQTDDEHEQFITDFWKRRDPTPGTPENEFKEEHYRRIAYTNEHFSTPSGLSGWKTDMGRIYITFGPPDEIDSHPDGGSYQRPVEDGGGTASTYPFQQWRYRYIQGIGNNIIIEFVDRDRTGDFHMTSDPSEKETGAAPAIKAGATVQPVGANGVRFSVPLDRYGDRPVAVSVRVLASDRHLVQTFENTIHGQMSFTGVLALTPGSYTLRVVVRDPATASPATDSIPFEVK